MERKELAKMSKRELLVLAKKLKIIGRYACTKDEIIAKVVKKYAVSAKGWKKNKLNRLSLGKLRNVNSFANRKAASYGELTPRPAKGGGRPAKGGIKGKRSPKLIKKAKEIFSRPHRLQTASMKSAKKRSVKERSPRPYWQAPLEPVRVVPTLPEERVGVLAASREKEFTFPKGYGDNHIVLLVRDPWWIYSYWEVSQRKLNEIRRKIGENAFKRSRTILRVYDVTGIIFNGSNAHSYFDIWVNPGADNWYIDVGKPNRSWCVDIGCLTQDKKFFLFARSNVVCTPRFGMSEVTDEEWMSREEDYWKLFGVAGGFGLGSSPLKVKKEFRSRLKEGISSGVPGSLFSLMGRKKERRFWMTLDTELIVYGATEPDARVSVQGKCIKLRQDGTFTLRFALPNGTQHIPVEATSNDGVDKRKVTPIVSRRTE